MKENLLAGETEECVLEETQTILRNNFGLITILIERVSDEQMRESLKMQRDRLHDDMQTVVGLSPDSVSQMLLIERKRHHDLRKALAG